MAIIGKDGKTFSHDLFKVGDQVTFLCGDVLKRKALS